MSKKPSSGTNTSGSQDLSEDRLADDLRAAIEKEGEEQREQLAALERSAKKAAESLADNGQQATDSRSEKAEPWVSEEAIAGFLDRIGEVTSTAFRFAKRTTNNSYKVGKALMQSQDQLKLMVAAGQSLKDLREVAGLTVNELSDAIQLKDKSMLEAVENGTATLSFELILRLSALLARNDPIPFILKYSRTYSPETWKLLHDWGAGRLPLQYQREREFINIYRSKDEARKLSDEGYNRVLAFTREAFNMALHFANEQEQITPPEASPKKSRSGKNKNKS